MKGKHKRRRPEPVAAHPGGQTAPTRPAFGRKAWRLVGWGLAALVVVGSAGFAIWYALSPPIPEVGLKPGADAELVEAVARDRAAIRRAPWSDEARGRLAMRLHVHRLDAAADTYYAQAEKLNPAEPRWPYLHSFVVADDPPAVLDLLRRAERLSRDRPGTPDALRLKLADACLEQEEFDEADQTYRQLLERGPDHARAHLGLARLAAARDKPDEALPHLKACADNPATRKAAHALRGEVLQRRGDTTAAAEETRRAVALPRDAPWPDPWLDQAKGLLVGRAGRLYRLTELEEQGRRLEAAAWAAKMIEDYPDIKFAEIARGRLDKGDWPRAEDAARQAVRLNPTLSRGHFYLGKALAGQGRDAEAAESFRRVTELEPANGLAYRDWARCAAAADRAEAVRLFRVALQYQPHDGECHRDLGELLAKDGQRQEALRHLDQAVRLLPEDRRTRQVLEQIKKESEGKKP